MAARFSVPLENVKMFTLDGALLPDEMTIVASPPKCYVDVLQIDGETTRYETELVL